VGFGEYTPGRFYRALETARERVEVVDIRGDIVGGGFLGYFVGFGKLRRLGLASDAVEKRAGVLREMFPTDLERFLVRVVDDRDMMFICEEVLAVVKELEKWQKLRARIAMNRSKMGFVEAMEKVKEARILAGGRMRVEIMKGWSLEDYWTRVPNYSKVAGITERCNVKYV